MPSQRKRIGFLPSQEVHEIIDKLCRDNEFSQSKVTGLLVEEALKSRGVLNNSFPPDASDKSEFINSDFEKVSFFKKNKSTNISDDYTVSKKELSENIKLMHEFLEYKYFKKIMKQNKKFFE
jgi:hypothetical protein